MTDGFEPGTTLNKFKPEDFNYSTNLDILRKDTNDISRQNVSPSASGRGNKYSNESSPYMLDDVALQREILGKNYLRKMRMYERQKSSGGNRIIDPNPENEIGQPENTEYDD